MLQMGTQQTTEMPTLKQAHTVSSTKTMERVENAVHDDTHQAICSVNVREYVNRHYKCVGVNKVCSQQIPHLPTHKYHMYYLNIGKSTVLRVRALCGMQCKVITILYPEKNQQVCNNNMPDHPD
jgi:hypothetical protein